MAIRQKCSLEDELGYFVQDTWNNKSISNSNSFAAQSWMKNDVNLTLSILILISAHVTSKCCKHYCTRRHWWTNCLRVNLNMVYWCDRNHLILAQVHNIYPCFSFGMTRKGADKLNSGSKLERPRLASLGRVFPPASIWVANLVLVRGGGCAPQWQCCDKVRVVGSLVQSVTTMTWLVTSVRGVLCLWALC
jgi:hypothetical protein